MADIDYKQQLEAVNQLLAACPVGTDKDELLSLKTNLVELISLLNDEEDTKIVPQTSQSNNKGNNEANSIDDEYAKFMLEINNEEGTNESNNENTSNTSIDSNEQDLRNHLEGKKFRAPHKHSWGETVYHNAMVSSIFNVGDSSENDELQVRVLFLNPTHKEMLPCPYYFDLERDCNFSESQCHFSHGELIPYSSLREYIEPKYELLTIGSSVLAKQSNNLWYRATIKQILEKKCLVKFDSKSFNNREYEEIEFEHILPLKNSENSDDDDEDDDSDNNSEIGECSYEVNQSNSNQADIINMTLMNTPNDQALGNWEKYTTGIGSKLMQKMGYIVGAGLGKKGVGIVNPITAIVLPPGKSLDYCMRLKEQHQDPNLFDADKKIKINQRREEKKQKRLKREQEKQRQHPKTKMNVCEFINFTLNANQVNSNDQEHQAINEIKEKCKTSSEKELNLANFMIEENMKKETIAIDKLRRVLNSFTNKDDSQTAQLSKKLYDKQLDLKRLKNQVHIIRSEINRRKNNKEMSVF